MVNSLIAECQGTVLPYLITGCHDMTEKLWKVTLNPTDHVGFKVSYADFKQLCISIHWDMLVCSYIKKSNLTF